MKKFLRTKTNQTQYTIEDQFYLIGIVFAAVFCIAMLYLRHSPCSFHLPPCLFHLITGYYCPGCGGTRALRALFDGHLIQSAWYHPFVPYAAAVYLCFMTTQTIERTSHGRFQIGMRYHNGFVWAAAALIIVNFLIKNLLHYRYGLIL